MGKPQIYISHSSKNNNIALDIIERLNSLGFESFSANEIIFPGDNWSERITTTLTNVDAFLFLISKDTTSNSWQSSEIAYAIAAKTQNPEISIIPIVIEKNSEIPFFLKELASIDISDVNDIDNQLNKIISIFNKPRKQLFDITKSSDLQLQALKEERKLFENQRIESNTRDKFNRISAIISSVSLFLAGLTFVITITSAVAFLHRITEFLLGAFCSAVSILLWSSAKKFITRYSARKGGNNGTR